MGCTSGKPHYKIFHHDDMSASDSSQFKIDDRDDLLLLSGALHFNYAAPDIASSHDESTEPDSSNSSVLPVVGDAIQVFWQLKDQSFNSKVAKILDDSRPVIHYDDDDVETLQLSNETWRFTSTASASTARSAVKLEGGQQLVLLKMLKAFRNKPIMLHHVQGLSQQHLYNAYRVEQDAFLRPARPFSRQFVGKDENVIGCSVIYCLKLEDDGS